MKLQKICFKCNSMMLVNKEGDYICRGCGHINRCSGKGLERKARTAGRKNEFVVIGPKINIVQTGEQVIEGNSVGQYRVEVKFKNGATIKYSNVTAKDIEKIKEDSIEYEKKCI